MEGTKKHKIHFNIIFLIQKYVFPSCFPIETPQDRNAASERWSQHQTFTTL